METGGFQWLFRLSWELIAIALVATVPILLDYLKNREG